MNQQELQHFNSLEAKVASLETEVRLHHEMVKEGIASLVESIRDRDRVTREEITVLTQTVRTVSEWQIGHANTTYHKDVADRVSEVESDLQAIKDLHIERWFKDSTEDRKQIRLNAVALEKRVTLIERARHDEEVASKASSQLLKRQTAVISFLVGLAGSAVGIFVALNVI